MRSKGYSSWFVYVCVSVCLSMANLALQATGWLIYEEYKRVQNNEVLKNKKAIFQKQLRSGDTSE